jgi:hypothetical protein
MTRAIRTAICAGLLAAACGTRQPVTEPPPPEPVRVSGDACPSPTIGANVAITPAIGEASSPVIAYDGEGFTLAWWDMRGKFPAVSTVGVDRAGARRGELETLPHDGAARDQTIAVDDAETHVVWMDESAVKSARLTGGTGAPVRWSERATSAGAGPRGTVAWVEKGVLYFRSDGMLLPADRDGVRAPAPPIPIARGGIEDPRIAWTGAQYAVVWSASVAGGRQIMLQRMSNAGVPVGAAVKVSGTAGISRKPEIVASPSGFAVVWTNSEQVADNARDRYRIFFALVPTTGAAPSATRQLEFNGTADQVAIAAAGTEYGLAWVGSKQPMGSAVFFARLDARGTPLGETVRVSDDKPLTCGRPSLAFAGDGYGVAWHDDREAAGSVVAFSFLSCGAPAPEAADAGAPAEADEPKLKKLFE